MQNRYTTIQISREVRDKLKKLGRKGETYNDILKGLKNHAEKCDRYWEDKN